MFPQPMQMADKTKLRQEMFLQLLQVLHAHELIVCSIESKQHRTVKRDTRQTWIDTLHTTRTNLQPKVPMQ